MELEKMVERINFLYKKSQEEGLTEEEKKEQAELRQKYINNVKQNFKAQIQGYKMVPPKKKN